MLVERRGVGEMATADLSLSDINVHDYLIATDCPRSCHKAARSRLITSMHLLILCIVLILIQPSTSFSPSPRPHKSTRLYSSSAYLKQIIYQAAKSRDVDSDAVVSSLLAVKKSLRKERSEKPDTDLSDLQATLPGRYQLVFITGTIDTQKKVKLSYVPIRRSMPRT